MEELVTLITESEIQQRVLEMAQEIRQDAGDQPILLLAVLKGAVPFLTDLSRAITGDVLIDYVQLSSYGNQTRPGKVHVHKDHDLDIRGQYTVVIDDILDTGATWQHLSDLLLTRAPACLKLAVLLDKVGVPKESVPDYVGFRVPNKFVVGYGLDKAEMYRNLRYIGYLK